MKINDNLYNLHNRDESTNNRIGKFYDLQSTPKKKSIRHGSRLARFHTTRPVNSAGVMYAL